MKYICSICGYVYDETSEGTAFADLPDSWVCPLCRAAKDLFRPEKTEAAPEPAHPDPEAAGPSAHVDTDHAGENLHKLSAGELSKHLVGISWPHIQGLHGDIHGLIRFF